MGPLLAITLLPLLIHTYTLESTKSTLKLLKSARNIIERSCCFLTFFYIFPGTAFFLIPVCQGATKCSIRKSAMLELDERPT
ncbi:hypothetical protein TNIN_245061 [Trichonephila inaurata madagascariensis]|uniref:Uncharacterized protein n=1 Tax=Trichonephila inaurata madagascariensis TaxID=2747483 RepID=A0A8X6XUZ3_9ARAC|nr:hypothetical protein TNIN_245061 [Trichonephila inaurata madagascariensis]